MLLSIYGPLSLIMLLALWAGAMILGFALLHVASGPHLQTPEGTGGFFTSLYFSGSSFFTLGLGDVRSAARLGKFLTVLEAGLGFGFLALVIAYLPALNQAFSSREVNISLLDARAGSPPSAAGMLLRHNYEHGVEELQQLLRDWERWSAEFLEIHLSYPVLAFFRSQHDNQSWLASLTAILDTCTLLLAGMEGACAQQARLTFAMARHAVVDLALVFNATPLAEPLDRLPAKDLASLREMLAECGINLHGDAAADRKLLELREMYEPYIHALSRYLLIAIPPWLPETGREDNWKTTAWGRKPGPKAPDLPKGAKGSHF
jgi:hypothetical protein